MSLHSETKCGYCGIALAHSKESRWDGEDDSLHYRQVNCNGCRKSNWGRVDFHGSGHDVLPDNQTIESILNKVQEK